MSAESRHKKRKAKRARRKMGRRIVHDRLMAMFAAIVDSKDIVSSQVKHLQKNGKHIVDVQFVQRKHADNILVNFVVNESGVAEVKENV